MNAIRMHLPQASETLKLESDMRQFAAQTREKLEQAMTKRRDEDCILD